MKESSVAQWLGIEIEVIVEHGILLLISAYIPTIPLLNKKTKILTDILNWQGESPFSQRKLLDEVS